MSSSSSSPASSSASSGASSSTSLSSIHPASLVDAALHSPHTLRLVGIKISKQLIDHVVDQVIDTVEYAMGKTSSPSSSSAHQHPRGRRTRTPLQTKFTAFASTVLARAEITTPTLLATLIYIARARPFLHIALEEWALERVFLGALITASKYLNDSTLKNVHWALCTGVFGKRDVGRIEREFLAVLDWELGVSEGEVLGLWEGLEWAVEEEEREERRVRDRAERRQREKAMAASAAEKKSASKFYVAPAPKSHSRSSSLESNASSSSGSMAPPPVPPKTGRNHHRRTHPAPAPVHVIHHLAPSPASSSASSSSSSSSNNSSPRTPSTPGYDLAYPTPEELNASSQHHRQRPVPQIYVQEASDAMDVDVDETLSVPPTQQKRSLKRSFGATTMEILKSFPFPGHHHSGHHSQHRSC